MWFAYAYTNNQGKDMSVVVVVKKDREIVIAADTLTTHYGYIGLNATHKANSEKMVKYRDSWIGSVGAAMAKQMFLQALQSNNKEFSLHGTENIYITMLKIHKILKKDHYLLASNRASKVESSQLNLLIANSSGIFGVSPDRYVADYSRFWANGSGKNFALGAMEQAYEKYSASEIARIGIEAACEFDKHCELPMNLHLIKEDLDKTKTKVIQPIAPRKICDNWCDNTSAWINKIKKHSTKWYRPS